MIKSAARIKETILNRVSQDWDVKGENFDPLIHLISGACANELEKVYIEMEESEQRILERFSKIILPQEELGALPAHTLAHVLPKGADCILTPEKIEWKAKKDALNLRVQRNDDYSFTPLSKTRLVNLTAKYLVADYQTYDCSIQKHLNHKMGKNDIETKKTVWADKFMLVLELKKPVVHLKDVSLFFEGTKIKENNFSDKALNEILASSKWFLNGQPISIKRGFFQEEIDLTNTFTKLKQIEDKIAKYYNSCFFTLDESAVLSKELEVKYALEWSEEELIIFEKLRKNIPTTVIQIEVKLRSPIPFDSTTFISPNIFPIVNRSLAKTQRAYYIREEGIHIIPINAEAPLLGIERVYEKGKEGTPFSYLPFAEFNKENSGLGYTVREKGIGHYDTYNFWSRFGFLLTKIKSEYTNSDLIKLLGNTLSIEEFYNLLGDSAQEELKPNNQTYILINSGNYQNKLEVLVTYWLTQAEAANGIELSTTLIGKSPDLKEESAIVISNTINGRQELTRIKGLAHVQSKMLSRNRIVTKEDIMAFCRKEVGENLNQISIEYGTELSMLPNHGLVRNIEVKIVLSDVSDKNFRTICEALETALNRQTSMLIPIRVQAA